MNAENSDKWTDAGFLNPVFESWTEFDLYTDRELETRNFTQSLKLLAITFRGAEWEVTDLKARFQAAGKVLSQCGIKFSRINLVQVDVTERWLDVDGQYVGNKINLAIVKALPKGTRPAIFFVRQSHDRNVAFSQPEFHVGPDYPLLDTVWITRAQIFWQSRLDPTYSTEAHEMAHVLGNFGHEGGQTPNLMAGWMPLLNGELREDQCAAIRRHRSLRPIGEESRSGLQIK